MSKIVSHLSEHKIQHDLRSGRSCETQLDQYIDDLHENLDSAHSIGHKQHTFFIMEVAKAFSVPHRQLLYKLE